MPAPHDVRKMEAGPAPLPPVTVEVKAAKPEDGERLTMRVARGKTITDGKATVSEGQDVSLPKDEAIRLAAAGFLHHAEPEKPEVAGFDPTLAPTPKVRAAQLVTKEDGPVTITTDANK